MLGVNNAQIVHLCMEPGTTGVLTVAVAPLRVGGVVEEIVDIVGQAHDVERVGIFGVDDRECGFVACRGARRENP